MEKKIIGVDCDEVLCLLMKDFIPKFCKAAGLDLKYEEFKEYDLQKYFHITEEKVGICKMFNCSIQSCSWSIARKDPNMSSFSLLVTFS